MKRFLAVGLAVLFSLMLLTGCFGGSSEDEIISVHTSSSLLYTQQPRADASEEPTSAPTAEVTMEPTAEPTAAVTPAPTEAEHKGGENGRRIFLTFDDGPNSNTGTTLDILNSYGIKATFFTVGQCVDANPGLTKRIVEEGHLLACHTYSHELYDIYQSTDAFLNDVAKWRRAVTNAVGWDAGSYCLRFPGGTTNTVMGGRAARGPYVEAVHAAGYKIYDWTMGTNDKWLAGNTEHLPVADYLWQSYKATYNMFVNTDKPLILLIHDDVPESIETLPRIIEDLISMGCSFGTVDELDDFLM